MATRAEAIRRARHGPRLTEWLQPPLPRAARRAGGAVAARRATPPLSTAERQQVLDTFAALVEGLYTHLPLKRARYASDPVQRLRILRQRLGVLDDAAFGDELAAIMTGLRDAHTRYIGPPSLEGTTAVLPFMVEAFGPTAAARYVASKVVDDPELNPDPFFRPGVELQWWNAVPIDRAVDRLADSETGGRPDSRRARALESLTVRALQFRPAPDEHWVIVGYVDHEGVAREARFDWRIATARAPRTASKPSGEGRRAHAIDSAAEVARRAKKLLYAPDVWYDDERAAAPGSRRPAAAAGDGWLSTDLRDVLAAKRISVAGRDLAYLRLWSFDVNDDRAYVDEVIRLLGRLPQDGVVIDLRANPGGLIWAAERLLQLFTPRQVVPTRFSLVATELTRAMAGAPQNLGELEPWRTSLDAAVTSGELYSQAVPITPPGRCNDIGQVYGGPAVAVVDANTYSAGDLFAAGFYDNEVGILVTVGEATGAGGANVWYPDDIADALLGTSFERPALPGGLSYSLSARRATRTGAAEGLAIEDVGVQGHHVYAMTQRDLTHGNADLLDFCGELLARRAPTALTYHVARHAIDLVASGLDRLDLFLDGRPFSALDPSAGKVTVPRPAGEVLEVQGIADGRLVQRRRIDLT